MLLWQFEQRAGASWCTGWAWNNDYGVRNVHTLCGVGWCRIDSWPAPQLVDTNLEFWSVVFSVTVPFSDAVLRESLRKITLWTSTRSVAFRTVSVKQPVEKSSRTFRTVALSRTRKFLFRTRGPRICASLFCRRVWTSLNAAQSLVPRTNELEHKSHRNKAKFSAHVSLTSSMTSESSRSHREVVVQDENDADTAAAEAATRRRDVTPWRSLASTARCRRSSRTRWRRWTPSGTVSARSYRLVAPASCRRRRQVRTPPSAVRNQLMMVRRHLVLPTQSPGVRHHHHHHHLMMVRRHLVLLTQSSGVRHHHHHLMMVRRHLVLLTQLHGSHRRSPAAYSNITDDKHSGGGYDLPLRLDFDSTRVRLPIRGH